MKYLLLSLFLVTSLTTSASAAVWPTENSWSPEWETTYREWVKTNGKTDFFSRTKNADGTENPYYGIRVDCADLVYSLRAIFAFENRLPFVIVNSVSPRGNPISNEISRYDSIPAGYPRFRRFLPWIYDLVSTHGLSRDTYSASFASVGPGTIILTSRKNHHSWTITDISMSGNPTLVFNSTVGRESGFKVQERKSWPNPYWIFEPETGTSGSIPVYRVGSYAGFRYWRSPGTLDLPESSVPGFSDEQFLVGLKNWKATAQFTLGRMAETIDHIVGRLLSDACEDFKQRVDAVTEVELFKSELAADLKAGRSSSDSAYVREWMSDAGRPSDARCLTAARFDTHSTPSRDRRFIDGLVLARTYFAYGIERLGPSGFSPESLKLYLEFFPQPGQSATEEASSPEQEIPSTYCAQKISGAGTLSLAHFKSRLFRGIYSANPNDSWSGRFGTGLPGRNLGKSCPAYGLVAKAPDLVASEAEAALEVRATAATK